MLAGITFYTDNTVWAGILSDLGATAASRDIADIVFISPDTRISSIELKSRLLEQIDRERTVATTGYKNLSDNQTKIINLLVRAGKHGITADSLKIALGYATDANSHALDTAIYNLRKTFGAEFIKTTGGKYFI
jgi:hypothetical protein